MAHHPPPHDDSQKIELIYRAIYIGNGKESLMVRMDRVERICKVLSFIAASITVALISTLIATWT